MAEDRVVESSWSGRKLDEWLHAEFPQKSKSAWQKEVRRGRVKLDGNRVLRSNVKLKGRERVRVEGVAAPKTEVRVLHEDDDLLVVSKPAGLLTHEASERLEEETLAGLLDAGPYGPLPRLLGEERPGIVHRLDRDTSGLVLIARTEEAFEKLRVAFRERLVTKRYFALVARSEESTADSSFECTSAIGPSPGQRDKQRVDLRQGKEAQTRFEVAEELGRDFALLSCFPKSGRRHQIRVHLQALGFQLLGDPMYRVRGSKPLPKGVTRPKRHALHAAELTLRHPRTDTELNVGSPDLPADMRELAAALRRQA